MEIDFKLLHKESVGRFNMEWPEWREKFIVASLEKTKKNKENGDIQEQFSNFDSGGSFLFF